jgi:hypothetical protein
MERLRQEFECDVEHDHFSDRPSEENKFELFCCECGRSVFSDEAVHDRFLHGLESDLDNQFLCNRCIEARDQVAHLLR